MIAVALVSLGRGGIGEEHADSLILAGTDSGELRQILLSSTDQTRTVVI